MSDQNGARERDLFRRALFIVSPGARVSPKIDLGEILGRIRSENQTFFSAARGREVDETSAKADGGHVVVGREIEDRKRERTRWQMARARLCYLIFPCNSESSLNCSNRPCSALLSDV